VAYPVNANDVCFVTIRGVLLDQVVMTTLAYRRPPGSTVVTNGSTYLDAIFANLDQPGDVLNDLTDILPGNLGEIVVDLQWIYPIRYRKQTYTPTVNVGQQAASTVSNLAAVITVNGEQANKRTISNKHIPIGQANTDAGKLDAAWVLDAAAFKAQILADLAPTPGTLMEPIIWGRPRPAFTKCGRDFPELPALRTDIIGSVIQDTVRVMRRRTLRIGV